MASNQAACTDSADAGARRVLSSALDTPVLAWDGMGRIQRKTFDGLQRLLRTEITEADGAVRLSEVLTYGEGQPTPPRPISTASSGACRTRPA